jgi:hypothetical protein
MGVVKQSVSFDADVWGDLARKVGSGPVSPLVNEALALDLRSQRGSAAVAACEAEEGTFTDAELAGADRLLHVAGVPDLRTQATSVGVALCTGARSAGSITRVGHCGHRSSR